MVWVVNVIPRPLYPQEGDQVPIVKESLWAPSPVWTGSKYLAPTGIRSPDHPATSESLYCLHYPGPRIYIYIYINIYIYIYKNIKH